MRAARWPVQYGVTAIMRQPAGDCPGVNGELAGRAGGLVRRRMRHCFRVRYHKRVYDLY